VEYIFTPERLMAELMTAGDYAEKEASSATTIADRRYKLGIAQGYRLAALRVLTHIDTLAALANDEDGSLRALIDKLTPPA
jgi:hypothetical protein